MPESHHDRLKRVRPPKVKISYKPKSGEPDKELPFLVGVISDLNGGNPVEDKDGEPVVLQAKERKFVNVDRDNFNEVLAGTKPKLSFQVDDKLSGKKGELLPVSLDFKSMADFSPAKVAEKVARATTTERRERVGLCTP